MKWCLVVAAVLALAASSASARESRSEARPVTLATVPGQVTGLSQDRNRIAWIVPNERCGHNVQVLTLPRRHPVTVGRRRDASCEGETLETVALGGRRLLWQGLTGTGNTELDVGLYTATLGSPRARRAGELSIARDPQDPDYVDPVPLLTASDGNTILVYWLCDDYCSRIDAGSVRRLAGGRTVRLARAVRPVGLAVAGSRFAVLTNTQRCCNYTPAWSPDGKRIAWILRGDVWTIAADGTDDRRLTTVGDAETPAWSNDGTQLAFDRSATGSTPSIYRIAADGSGLQRLATGSGPAWSPDGTRIAFVRANDVYTITPDGTGETRLTTDAVLNTFDLTWSPDGTKIAATRNGRIHVIRADGGGDLNIAAGFNPDWSPDGTKLVYSSGTSGLYGLFVIKPDGSGNTQITTEVDEHPDWSPNGTRIVFANSSRSPAGIWSVNADGSNPTPLSQGIIGENPHWAPDGSTVAFADDPVDSDGGTGLRLVSPTGTNLRTIAPVDRWTVELRATRNGALIRRFSSLGRAREIAVGKNYVAILIAHSTTNRLELYNFDGAFRKAAPVPGAAQSVAAAGNRVVFAVGRTVRFLDARIVVPRIIARTRALPLGLSIEGNRVAWAETIGRNSRIRALRLG